MGGVKLGHDGVCVRDWGTVCKEEQGYPVVWEGNIRGRREEGEGERGGGQPTVGQQALCTGMEWGMWGKDSKANMAAWGEWKRAAGGRVAVWPCGRVAVWWMAGWPDGRVAGRPHVPHTRLLRSTAQQRGCRPSERPLDP